MKLQFERQQVIKKIGKFCTPLVIGGGYDISGGSTRLSWCAGISLFFWTPFWIKMTKGLKEIIRCSPREEIVIISGNPFNSQQLNSLLFEATLKILNIEKVDIWLQLWAKNTKRIDDSMMTWVEKKKKENKIGLFGISTHRHEVAEEAIKRDDIDVLMLRHNAAHRYYENFFQHNSNLIKDKLVITYTSTKWGYLVNRDSDWLSDREIPTSADCYAYALDNKYIDVVLFGPKNKKELEEAFTLFTYSQEDWKIRKTLLEEYGVHIFNKYGINNSYKENKKLLIFPR